MKPNKFLKNRSGIYGIRNLINDKIYIGKTKCMYRRCHQYVYDFNNRSIGHLNDYLYNAINKIGIDNFEFFPLQFDKISNLSELELFWIVQLKSTDRNHGYNIRIDSSSGMVTSDETSKKISNNLKRQWANGVRDTHGQKLSENWANNPKRKKEQSVLMSKNKTKYEYDIYKSDHLLNRSCDYKILVGLGLKNVISQFHRKKSNDVFYKGFRVIRFNKGERDEN